MSRNIDKANTVLFRYQEQQAEANGYRDYNSTARPTNVNKIKSIKEAENWRNTIIKEINEKILRINSEIQLSEYQIRDLNEDINKLCKEKYTFEYHILNNLNGVNYNGSSINKYIENNSIKIKGYRYFGKAKELKDVRELIERQELIKKSNLENFNNEQNYSKKIKELENRADIEYFGYLEDVNTFEDERNKVLGIEVKDKLENKATRQRIKKLNKVSNSNEIKLIKSTKPISNEKISEFLIEKRKKELQLKYNI